MILINRDRCVPQFGRSHSSRSSGTSFRFLLADVPLSHTFIECERKKCERVPRLFCKLIAEMDNNICLLTKNLFSGRRIRKNSNFFSFQQKLVCRNWIAISNSFSTEVIGIIGLEMSQCKTLEGAFLNLSFSSRVLFPIELWIMRL